MSFPMFHVSKIFMCAAVQMYSKPCWRHYILLTVIQAGTLIKTCYYLQPIAGVAALRSVIVTYGSSLVDPQTS